MPSPHRCLYTSFSVKTESENHLLGPDGDDSSLEDDSTIKSNNGVWVENGSNHDGSTSDISSTSSERRPTSLRG